MSFHRHTLSRLVLLLSLIVTSLITTSQPAFSQPTEVVAAPAAQPQPEPPTDQIIIKYRSANTALSVHVDSAANLQRLSDAVAAPLSYVRPMTEDTHVVSLPERRPLAEVAAIADRLAQLPEIEYAEPDRVLRPLLTPNDPQYVNQWHYFGAYGIDAPAAWDITTGSTDIVVAVIDTGILPHADLAGRTLPGYDFITNVSVANDGNGRDADPSDPGDWTTANECYAGATPEDSSWHGTHVAGTIGAASNNGFGVAGINWVSKILPVRVLGKCGGYTSDIVDGMKWAAGLTVTGVPNNPNPAKVLNLSLGGSGACDATQQAAINSIVSAGTTVVVAAGNSNQDAAGFNPASCNNVIAVAATNQTGQRSYYSNYGSVVDIAAPGGEQSFSNDPNGVLSTLNAGTTTPGADAYVYYQGTSMATPHVVGIASLVLSLIPTATPAQVTQILQNTVKAFPSGSSPCTTSICGTGIANAFNAVKDLPRITDFSPKQIDAGSLTTTLTITGANFSGDSIVKWNAVNLATTYVGATQLTAVIPSSLLVTPSAGVIKVTGTHAPYGSLTTATRSIAVTGGEQVYLPIVALNFQQAFSAPVLLAINNAGNTNAYSVVWNPVAGATSYTLQEDDNASFTSPTVVYNGSGSSQSFSNKPVGTYYYRVKATNSSGDSPWSTTRSTVVQGASTGISGRITYMGNPLSGVSVELRLYNGSAFSSAGTTTTQADGTYKFLGAASLSAGQSYYVRYQNAANSAYLAYAGSPDVTSYTAGSSVPLGTMDIANIPMVAPAPGATVALPRTFQWSIRTATPSDNYEFNLEPDVTGSEIFYTTVGYAGSYVLNSLPAGFSTGKVYDWYIGVYGNTGVSSTYYGLSYYYRTVTFSGGLATQRIEQPLTEKEINRIELRRLSSKNIFNNRTR